MNPDLPTPRRTNAYETDAYETDAYKSDARADIAEADGDETDGTYETGASLEPTNGRLLGPRWDVEPPDPIDRPRNRVLVGAAVAIVIAALGVPLAYIWSSVAPWLPAQVSGNELIYADPEGEQRAGAEGWFILLMLGTGIVVALIAWFVLRRFRGSVMVAALAIGSTAAGWLTWRIGHTIGLSGVFAQERTAVDGDIIKLPPALRIKSPGDIAMWHHIPYLGGVLLYMAMAAVATYVLAVLVTTSPSLNRRKQAPVPEQAGAES